MKKLCILLAVLLLAAIAGCGIDTQVDIAATTLPVYDFTASLCEDTPLTVGRMVTESVSCLHDYTLQTSQMRMIEGAEVIVISGAGLEDFLADAIPSGKPLIDASVDAHIHNGHDHAGHSHAQDPHLWLSPSNARMMAANIAAGLTSLYPAYADTFSKNLSVLQGKLEALQVYGEEQLSDLKCRELVTFHDGFAYFAESFDLQILKAVEEESGSEASAAELKELIFLVERNQLPAIFIEQNGSVSAADVISAETGASVYSLDMAMADDSYFDAMYHNINTVKEALG